MGAYGPSAQATSIGIAEPAINDAMPTPPVAGLLLFLRKRAGRRMLSVLGPSGQDTSLQPALFSNRVALWSAVPGVVAPTQVGIAATANGTATLIAPTTTNFFTRMTRLRYASSATAGNAGGIRQTVTSFFRGSAADLGGFFMVARFGIAQATATNRVFVGMAATGGIAGSVNPSTLLNIFGIGCDASQTTLRVMSNDASGTATMTDLGANFPAATSAVDFYEVRLFCASGAVTKMGWSIKRLNTGHFAEGEVTTDLPVADTLMAPHVHHSNGTTATAAWIDIQSLYIETDN
jgi:hypothetical protein